MWFLLALVCVGITCALGFWQLDRAQTKLDWQAEINQKGQLPVLEDSF
jgi:cytochrome oxidase assembly protein ShyY1